MKFHRIWVDQCEACEGIRERFGVDDALHYLIGEKLLSFIEASDSHPEFLDELPKFASQIKEIFEPYQIAGLFAELESEAAADRSEEWVFDSFEDAEIEPADVVNEARRVLLIERAKELLS